MVAVTQRTAYPGWAVRLWDQKLTRYLIFAFLIVGTILAYREYEWRQTPEYCIGRFIAAVNRQDADTALECVSAAEKKHLGLTATSFRQVLREVSGTPNDPRLIDPMAIPMNSVTSLYNRWARMTLTARDGRTLRAASGGPMTVELQAYNTEHGWKVSASSFLYGVIIERVGINGVGRRYVEICRRNGITPQWFNPADATWVKFRSAM